jgi:predicted nucleotidyltransferase
MGITPNEKRALKELRTKLSENYSLVDFRLYGSKAKGTDIPESDLDVMIVLEVCSPIVESEIDDLIFNINLQHDCFITALFFSRSELDTGALSESPVYKKILQEGISV